MPRKPRQHVPGSFYHVILRGNARRDVFLDDADRLLWQRFVGEGLERWDHRIHAYCWMTNHVHVAIQAGDEPLAGFIGTLASRYAKAFNKKYERSGHLFERRYRAILVRKDAHLLQLLRYIHQNPLRARLVNDPDRYPWCSHVAYAGGPCPPFLAINYVLSLFDRSLPSARHQYLAFVRSTPPSSILKKIRSGSNDDDDALANDDRALRWPDKGKPRAKWGSLDQLIEERCTEHRITEAELASASRARDRAELRTRIALEAVECGLCSVTEIARRFGRSQPTLSEAMNKRRRRVNNL